MPALAPENAAEQSYAFGFPVPPYPVQMELMNNVYETLEHGGVGILESPTGTGKTLSLLCPALSWLKNRERDVLAETLLPAEHRGDIEDWIRDHHQVMARGLAQRQLDRRKEAQAQRRVRVQKAGVLSSDGTIPRDKFRKVADPASVLEAEDEFVLESKLVLEKPEEMLKREGLVDEVEAVNSAYANKLQIIFCSRTHSQLSQVLGEIKRIASEKKPENLTVVTLGARGSLCINDSVRSRARSGADHATHLNDLCRKAVEKGKAAGGCTLKQRAQAMADQCLTEPLDMEAMVQRGRAVVGGGCPYYGSRQAVPEADVVLVPYASLVNSETRRRLRIRLKGNILIFDEAHNLLEAISDSNSVSLSALQARCAVDELEAYANRYESRLSARNALRLGELRQLCQLLHEHLSSLEKSAAHTVGGFLVAAGADHFDLPALSSFLETTELPRKVRGYSEAVCVRASMAAAAKGGGGGAHQPGSVYHVASLLSALLGSTTEDRILCTKGGGGGGSSGPGSGGNGSGGNSSPNVLRYLSLDAEARFRDLVTEARAVIFAGGTLEPRAEFAPLYSGAQQSVPQVVNFSGQHVVPATHVFARYVTHGPAGHLLDFRKDARTSGQQSSQLRDIIASCAQATPGGAIFFFPSFEYLAHIATMVGSRLGNREVFMEQQRGGADAHGRNNIAGESVLRGFAATVRRDGGAVLLAVSGGKLSEGIDFKDDLCRLVAVVGLPYPNASDMALLEKMRYLDACKGKGGPGLTGREFYTARCMKTVNQCIGRAIRHINDWAAVVLLDHRYANASVNGSISRWLREGAVRGTFADTQTDLIEFFRARGQGA